MISHIETLGDPRLSAYRDLKDRDVASLPGGLFIAEGEQVVKRLLASRVETDSVLLAARRVDEIAPLVPAHVPVYVGPDEVVNGIIGFKFHSGVIAAGRRPKPFSVEQLVSPRDKPLTLIVCPELANTENLGVMIRIAAAFGGDAMILGEKSCDPFFRQSVRVSMGSVFTLPIARSENLSRELEVLRDNDVELIATVLDDNAEDLSRVNRSKRVALLFGNEAQGLSSEHIDLCDRRVTIPMKLGTDSLNVSIAAAVFLYHFTQNT